MKRGWPPSGEQALGGVECPVSGARILSERRAAVLSKNPPRVFFVERRLNVRRISARPDSPC